MDRKTVRDFVARAMDMGLTNRRSRFTWRDVARCLGVPETSLNTFRGNETRRRHRQSATVSQ